MPNDDATRLAREFLGMGGGQPMQQGGGGDKNANGVPDREEMTLKISRPAGQGMRTPQTQPGQPVGNLIPQGVDVRNLGQFLRTPAGRDSIRQLIDQIVRGNKMKRTTPGLGLPFQRM